MKKTILSMVLCVMALAVSAQTLKTDLKKGDVRKYESNIDFSLGAPMQGEQKCSAKVFYTYTVSDANANGWIVEMKVDSLSTTGNQMIISQAVNSNFLNAIKETPARLKLDKKGLITGLENSDAVLASFGKQAIASINDLYASHPEIGQALPKTKAMMKANDELNLENLMKIIDAYSVFSLNGKDLKANDPADDELFGLFKVLSTYSISKDANGQTVISKKSSGNMKEEDIKGFLKKQMGDQADDSQIEQIWGQLKAFGMTSVDIDNNETYSFNNVGWLSDGSQTAKVKIAGAVMSLNQTIKPM